MQFETWLDAAWRDHADDSAGVAARIESQGPDLARGDADLAALARLAQHVLGEHLGQGARARALLQRLSAHPGAGRAAADALRVLDASLALCEGEDPRAALAPSQRVRAAALAAAALAGRDTPRAAALLHEALAAAEAAALADDDAAVRALAVTGNNLACTLEDKAVRSEAERRLMILAARTARAHWARAGTWLETERAEYRLARTWLQAGDTVQARRHAQACLDLVRAHDGPPLEVFFGWEALGLAEAAAGSGGGHAEALVQARAAFARLDDADRGRCRASLDALAGLVAPAASPGAPPSAG